jgi:hypothetical protein
MNCEEATRCIKPFIEGKIEKDELAGFLQHVEGCKDCYEELDIMYIVSEGLEGLHSASGASFDFTGMLAGRIAEGKRYLQTVKRRETLRGLVSLTAYAAIALAALRYFGFM